MSAAPTAKPFHNEIILKFLISPRYRIFRHLSLIVLLVAAFYNGNVEFTEPVNTYAKIAMFSMLLSLFYINMYLLVPRLLFRDNYLGYFLWIIGWFVLVQTLVSKIKEFMFFHIKTVYARPHDGPNLFAFSFIFMILFGASAAVKLFQRWIVDSQRINDLETATIQSELEHLKKQINPHFLFNMLNNANVLTQIDPVRASQVLIKLSDLLRYQLYDSVQSNVFLTSDIQFLEDFLNLEKIRRDNFDFTICKDGALEGVEIAPLLFITFVENAIKHNIDAEEPSFVDVFFFVVDGELHFRCINSIPRIKVAQNGGGGLGLANVKRRLELIYPNRYQLIITDDAKTFDVHLKIKI
ncbi:sensor histidine kinase [Pedobacter sp. L105]|uniref:sensor histidine kinase n=1 Tax=Pedobacter sp. L105 TaxID=1641871 RepID=UPI00131B4870|nr:histidine kinase [Pedobacter sp. L105]